METFVGRRGPRKFDLGLFECFSSSLAGPQCCFVNCCCSQCLGYDLLTLSGVRGAEGVFAADLFGTVLQASGNDLLSTAGAGIGAAADVGTRTKIARKLGIVESGGESFVAACCCPPCSMAQMAHEVAVRRGASYSCVGLAPAPLDMQRAAGYAPRAPAKAARAEIVPIVQGTVVPVSSY